MRVSEVASVFESYYDHVVVVRSFQWGQVVSGVRDGVFVLILREQDNPRHTLYEYDDLDEYMQDVERVRRFPGGGDANSGVPAVVGSPPPTRFAHDAKPIPKPIELE